MFTPQKPIENAILSAVPKAEYTKLAPLLEPTELTFGQVLYEPTKKMRYVYFPNDSLVSLLTLVDAHRALEVGLVGREGMVGVAVALGINASPIRAMTQGSGSAMRMSALAFRKAFQEFPGLRRQVLHYTHELMSQIAQTAACNRFHVIEARLARWLLMTRDRVQSAEFHLTHEFLGHMLGVRRVGVTNAAHALKTRGLIDYSRGDIAITDIRGLEAASCSCYEKNKDRQFSD
jgi:CRP-like cAMP-binding protein